MQGIQDMELFTAVDLNFAQTTGGKSVYHFVYASQLYGTMFAIYAKFLGEEVKIAKDNAFQINGISMRLLNYKGVLNIGFTPDDLEYNSQKDELGFTVRGGCSDFEKDSNLSKPITVLQGQRQLLTFVRTVIPLSNYESYLQKREGEKSNFLDKNQPPTSSWFDTEFNDRDGIDLYNTHYRPGMIDCPPRIVGFRCNTSAVNLYY